MAAQGRAAVGHQVDATPVVPWRMPELRRRGYPSREAGNTSDSITRSSRF
ncbi:hypothetical protein MRB56_12145 [Halomonas cupida]|nr:hypothetical protein [Halomonas cupida]